MTEEGDTSISHFVDQIVEKTFEALADRAEFDEATLTRLRELAESKGLSKFESVVDAMVGVGKA